MKVIAIKPHSPDGSKKYRKGDVYEISDQSARFLIAMNFVREVQSKREYERRDMQATKH